MPVSAVNTQKRNRPIPKNCVCRAKIIRYVHGSIFCDATRPDQLTMMPEVELSKLTFFHVLKFIYSKKDLKSCKHDMDKNRSLQAKRMQSDPSGDISESKCRGQIKCFTGGIENQQHFS